MKRIDRLRLSKRRLCMKRTTKSLCRKETALRLESSNFLVEKEKLRLITTKLAKSVQKSSVNRTILSGPAEYMLRNGVALCGGAVARKESMLQAAYLTSTSLGVNKTRTTTREIWQISSSYDAFVAESWAIQSKTA